MENGVEQIFKDPKDMNAKAYEIAKGLLKTKWGFTHVHNTPIAETDWKPGKVEQFPYLSAIKDGKRLLKFKVIASEIKQIARKPTGKGVDATILIKWKNTEDYNSEIIYHQ